MIVTGTVPAPAPTRPLLEVLEEHMVAVRARRVITCPTCRTSSVPSLAHVAGGRECRDVQADRAEAHRGESE